MSISGIGGNYGGGQYINTRGLKSGSAALSGGGGSTSGGVPLYQSTNNITDGISKQRDKILAGPKEQGFFGKLFSPIKKLFGG